MNDEYSSLAQASQDWHAPTGFEGTDSPSRSSRSLPAHGPAVKPSTCAAPDAQSSTVWGCSMGRVRSASSRRACPGSTHTARHAPPCRRMRSGEGFISEIEILRGDLVDLLYQQLGDGIEWIFNDTITELAQSSNYVNVTFRGARPQRFDFVIGADGLHSAVRTAAFGREEDFVHPLGLYTAWFTAPAFEELDNWYQLYNHTGGLVASIRPGSQPSESKAALSFRTRPGERVGHDRRDRASQIALLEDRFGGVGWHVPRLLEAARSASDFSFDEMGKVQLSRWWNGRIALIGDAAACPTPLSGLGTSVALVGAYVLAGELGDGSDHAAAFAAYDRLVRPYVEGAQQLAGGPGGYAPMTALAIRFMQASMSWATRWPMRGFMEKQFSKASDIDLPDYTPA